MQKEYFPADRKNTQPGNRIQIFGLRGNALPLTPTGLISGEHISLK